jgi:hypothetical protein
MIFHFIKTKVQQSRHSLIRKSAETIRKSAETPSGGTLEQGFPYGGVHFRKGIDRDIHLCLSVCLHADEAKKSARQSDSITSGWLFPHAQSPDTSYYLSKLSTLRSLLHHDAAIDYS